MPPISPPILQRCAGSYQLVNGKKTWVCDTTFKPDDDRFLEGGDAGTGFMPNPELLRLLHAGPTQSASQNRVNAKACRERVEGMRKATESLAAKGFQLRGAGEVAGSFQVDRFVVTIGRATKARAVTSPAEAAAVAQVLAQMVLELDTLATALDGSAWMAEQFNAAHRD